MGQSNIMITKIRIKAKEIKWTQWIQISHRGSLGFEKCGALMYLFKNETNWAEGGK